MNATRIRFGSCVVDLTTRRLYRDGRNVHITPKAFDLLAALIVHAPRALTKTELVDRVWSTAFVSDDALARLISDLRHAVGDRARQSATIRTIHGFGYAFDAPLHDGSPAASRRKSTCMLTWANRDYYLNEGANVIGRDPDIAVPINSAIVSRRHARVVVDGGIAHIEDLDSKNGTFLANQRLTAARELKDGDVIRVGEYELRFGVFAADEATAVDEAVETGRRNASATVFGAGPRAAARQPTTIA